jgi:ABC-type antimicrobial peptide transport system permease subunit
MRSGLTCLGIVIGIATVITLVEVGDGTAEAVRNSIETLGTNFIQVEAGASSSNGVHSGAATCLTLTPQDCQAILRECSTVRWAAPGVDCRMQVIYGNRNWQPWKILGTSPAYFEVRNWTELEEGDLFTESDVRSGARVCLLGQTPLRELFGGESPIGKEVRVRNVRLQVIGVLTRKGANMMGLDQDDIVVVPWTTVKFQINGSKLAFAQEALDRSVSTINQINTLNNRYPVLQQQLYPLRSASQLANTPQMVRFVDLDDIFISVRTSEEIPQATEEITSLLRQRHRLRADEPDDFGIRNWIEGSKTVAATTTLMTTLLLCVAVISLIVGGVGVMNIMLVSVTERTREIGLRMAVGARARDILRQFLAEAVVLCVFGGMIGVALGRGGSVVISAIWGWPTIPSFTGVFFAVAVSVLVGLVSGYFPAWKASRLDPIGSLRYE